MTAEIENQIALRRQAEAHVKELEAQNRKMRRAVDPLCAARPTAEPKVYEVVKFVNPRDAVAALEGLAVHAVAGPNDADAHGILIGHPGCMVSFYDVLTHEETVRTDIRNFVEVIVL